MPHVVLNWLTAHDITPESFGECFFRSMQEHIPRHMPSVGGVVEPPAVPFSEMVEVLHSWGKRLIWRDESNGVEGDVHHGKFWHSCVRHDYEAPFHATDNPVALLREASVLFGVDFSCCHLFQGKSLSPEDDMLQGLVSTDLQSNLPTVPWCCCFGPAYLDLIGRERIAAAPFWRVEDLGGYLLCLSAERAADCIGEQFQRRREEIKDAMGREYFRDPLHPDKKAIVPAFKFLRSRSEPSST